MKPETINRTSFDLMQDPNITARIKNVLFKL